MCCDVLCVAMWCGVCRNAARHLSEGVRGGGLQRQQQEQQEQQQEQREQGVQAGAEQQGPFKE